LTYTLKAGENGIASKHLLGPSNILPQTQQIHHRFITKRDGPINIVLDDTIVSAIWRSSQHCRGSSSNDDGCGYSLDCGPARPGCRDRFGPFPHLPPVRPLPRKPRLYRRASKPDPRMGLRNEAQDAVCRTIVMARFVSWRQGVSNPLQEGGYACVGRPCSTFQPGMSKLMSWIVRLGPSSLILRDAREALYVKPLHPASFKYKIIEMRDDQVSPEVPSHPSSQPRRWLMVREIEQNEKIIAYFNP